MKKSKRQAEQTATVLTRRELLLEVARTSGIAAGVGALGLLAYSDEPLRPRQPWQGWRYDAGCDLG